MSYKDFEHYVKKGGSTAMLMLALEASAINAAAQERQGGGFGSGTKRQNRICGEKG